MRISLRKSFVMKAGYITWLILSIDETCNAL